MKPLHRSPPFPSPWVPALALALGLSSVAYGQISVTYSLRFTEVLAGTSTPVPSPDGLIEPGEGARVFLTVTVAPGIGSSVTFTPPPAPGFGTLAALSSVHFDLNQTSAQGGFWSLFERAQGWALGGLGTGNADGSFSSGQAGQFILPGMTANAANPIADIWRGTWTPGTYTPRNVSFRCAAAATTQLFDTDVLIEYGNDPNGNPLYVQQGQRGTPGDVHIPIVPAPSAGILMTLALAPTLRRRRR